MGIRNIDLQTYSELIGFSGEKVHLDGFITLYLALRSKPLSRTVKVDFLVVDYPSAYNIILGLPTLNKISAVMSTLLLTIKFVINDGKVGTVKANQATARRCYNDSLKISSKRKRAMVSNEASMADQVLMIELDT